ncbi:MAG: hypothetical protein DRO04_00105 [Candidatus Iainarchaeum archaeon]|uniref:Uncharacterized protein n=1 Tax=Candidatus Iainarchaeum sp. TaxID=3101447 RepID=A0A497JLL3_9ARCH|nr:MAG: hypothetical protein DRO04_00105 [Candidatus Diapherotrites archaeon]
MFEYKGKEINTMAEVKINDKRYFLLSLSDNKDSRQREWAEMFLPVAEAERFLALPDETTVVREQIPHPQLILDPRYEDLKEAVVGVIWSGDVL